MTSVNTAKEHIQGQRGKNTSLKADVRIDGHDQRELVQRETLMDSGKSPKSFSGLNRLSLEINARKQHFSTFKCFHRERSTAYLHFYRLHIC